MRITLVLLASLAPYLYATNSLAGRMEESPLEVRDLIYEYLPLRDLVSLYDGLQEKNKDLLPTDFLKIKAIFQTAEDCGKRLPDQGSCEDVAIAIDTFFLKSAPKDDLSSFEYFISRLLSLFTENDDVFVGVAKAISTSLNMNIIDALGRLSDDIYAKIMPPLLRILKNEGTPHLLDVVITDQRIMDNPELFLLTFGSRGEEFVLNILKTDDVKSCQLLASKPDAKPIIDYLLPKLRQFSLLYRAVNVTTFLFSSFIRELSLAGKNVAQATLSFLNDRPDIFSRVYEEIKDLIPPKDMIVAAINMHSSSNVTYLLFRMNFKNLIDDEIVKLAWNRVLNNENQKEADKIFRDIIEEGLKNGLDLTTVLYLLMEGLRHNYEPILFSTLSYINPSHQKVPITREIIDAFRIAAPKLHYNYAEVIVGSLGGDVHEIDWDMWTNDHSSDKSERLSMLLRAFGVEEDVDEKEDVVE